MAEIIQQSSGGDGKKRAKKLSTRVDMTPMVDLAFLLLTFFVLTSTFSKPKVLRMIFPEKLDKNNPQVKQPEVKNGLTFLLTKDNRLFYYNGSLKADNPPVEINYRKDGLRQVLIERNAPLIKELKELQNKMAKVAAADTAAKNKIEREAKDAQQKSSLVILVKPDKDATYENVIDMIDEFLIHQVAKYFVVDTGFDPLERKMVDEKLNQ